MPHAEVRLPHGDGDGRYDDPVADHPLASIIMSDRYWRLAIDPPTLYIPEE